MPIKFLNNAYGVLTAPITESDTVINVMNMGFPKLKPDYYYYATLMDTDNNLEIVKITKANNSVLTVERAQEGTIARSYIVEDRIEHRITSGGLNAIADEFDIGQYRTIDIVSGSTSTAIDSDNYFSFSPTLSFTPKYDADVVLMYNVRMTADTGNFGTTLYKRSFIINAGGPSNTIYNMGYDEVYISGFCNLYSVDKDQEVEVGLKYVSGTNSLICSLLNCYFVMTRA